jgi:hypothetical protein
MRRASLPLAQTLRKDAVADQIQNCGASSPRAPQASWNHLLLARDLQFATGEELSDLDGRILKIQRMLAALAQRLRGPVLARS